MYFSVKNVDLKPGFELTFANGAVRKFDMKPFLEQEYSRELKNAQMFNTVRVSFNTIVWENDADFHPEALYEGGLPLAD